MPTILAARSNDTAWINTELSGDLQLMLSDEKDLLSAYMQSPNFAEDGVNPADIGVVLNRCA